MGWNVCSSVDLWSAFGAGLAVGGFVVMLAAILIVRKAGAAQ